MTRKAIIEKTMQAINQLPDEQAEKVSVFADSLIRRHEEVKLLNGIKQIVSETKSFEFLSSEQELYTKEDLKERYNG